MAAMKKCTGKCGEWKEATKANFSPNQTHSDQLAHECNKCRSAKASDKYREKKEFNAMFGIV